MDTNHITRLKESGAISELIQLLSNDDIEIRKSAVNALGDLKANEAVMALLPLLEDSDSYIRLQTSRSLGNICDPRAVEGLIKLLTDKEDYVRWNSAEALGKIGDPRAIESLITALKDRNKLVRKDAVKALSGFTENKAVEALKHYNQTKEGRADSTPGMSQMEKNKRAETWMLSFASGIIAGVVFAIARSYIEGAGALIVPGLAYVFFIQNKNMGFSWLQKILATGWMFIVGIHWRDILLLMK